MVTARGDRGDSPYIVAIKPTQVEMLVELALREPDATGAATGLHTKINFYVWDRPVGMGLGAPPRRWLQVGFFGRFGGVFFSDETTSEGDDWAWLALRPAPFPDSPFVYFDQEGQVRFPPRAVMPVSELRDVVIEWATTGVRPTCVPWLTVNAPVWQLDGAGDPATDEPN
ncbi:Imm1 family immunity protein [Actinokineospora sp.]|uniref:Imm1 family immunity protein n=1 Tax=Actinokineospora sp. TaxID=1872133 RepID=UPI004037AE1B